MSDTLENRPLDGIPLAPPESALGLSIDVEAELVSITERQHLNQVHWAVQLVRHALDHGPRQIDVRVRRRTLELRHDGDALYDDEHALLLAITRGPEGGKQEALAALEARFGVTILSLLLTAPRVEIRGRYSLVAEHGRVRSAPASSGDARIVVWRKRGSPREERAELRFYCRHVNVPFTLDGKRLNEPFSLEGAFATRRIRTDDATGLVGLPKSGALTRVRYYKRGVYFGVRQHLPSDGRPAEALFDSRILEHEDNFERSVHGANGAIREGKAALYAELPERFPSLNERERTRVREIVLGHAGKELPDALQALPLFATSTSPWRLTLDDLAALARRYGRVPYLAKRERGDDELPLLTPPEVAAIARLLNVPVRRALRFRPRRSALSGLLSRIF